MHDGYRRWCKTSHHQRPREARPGQTKFNCGHGVPSGNVGDSCGRPNGIPLKMLKPLKQNAPMSYLLYRKMKDFAPTLSAANTVANPVRILKVSPQIMHSVCIGISKKADSSPRTMLKTQLRSVSWVANIAGELFGDFSAIGQEVKVRFSWRLPSVRLRVVGVMKAKGSSLSSWRSLDDTVCVPLTTRQQRLIGNPYVDRLVLFFKKDADVYSIIDSAKDCPTQKTSRKR